MIKVLRRRPKTTIFLVLALLVWGIPKAIARAPEIDCDHLGPDCRIEAHILSDQDHAPFLFLGRVMNSDHPQWRKYRRAIRRYNEVEACLLRSERHVEKPNLLMMDWKRVGTGTGAEVCIFRIAQSVRGIHELSDWMKAHGFTFWGPSRAVSEGFVPDFPTQRVSHYEARWSIDQYRGLNPSLLSMTGLELLKSYYVNVGLDSKGRVVDVSVGTPTRLN